MQDKNSVILGLIRKLTDYGDYSRNISAESLQSIFHEGESFASGSDDFYNYAYTKICSNEEALQAIFSEHAIFQLGNFNHYKSFLYVTQRMGLVLLFAVYYKGLRNPALMMSLFMRLIIEKAFENPVTRTEVTRFEGLEERIAKIFQEAWQFNYELAICAFEPLWGRMTFYTNGISLYYCAKESLAATAIFSQYDTPAWHGPSAYRVFHIDYLKHLTFYLPVFGLEKEESLKSLVFHFRESLPETSKLGMAQQQQAIQKLFESVPAEQQEFFTGNTMLVFRV